MNYLDTGVLISALYLRDDRQADCQALLTRENVTSTHALAEAFAALNGQYRVRNDLVSAAVLSAAALVRVEPITLADYEAVLRAARARSIQGGGIYDALHAEVARRVGAKRLLTFNLSHFQHLGGELAVETP